LYWRMPSMRGRTPLVRVALSGYSGRVQSLGTALGQSPLCPSRALPAPYLRLTWMYRSAYARIALSEERLAGSRFYDFELAQAKTRNLS
jgi:hypothetical protein